MGLFDFLKSDKNKEHEAAEKAKGQAEQQAAAGSASATMGGKYADATAAGERSAATAPHRAPESGRAMPSPTSAAHKAVPVSPKPPMAAPPRPPVAAAPRTPAAPPPPVSGPAMPSPTSAAHKAVPVSPKPSPTAKKRMYTVKEGDSLSAIARRELGNEARWRELYAMNRAVVGPNPDMILPGMVLTLPH
ncbi:LysM peptidoglycan-binding domain-containing protein [Streptomyces lavendulae]|uniref:LysM peptidoglycan-binding domain-containing protein n=1 Tax=Streptomyces TaxID=1883 RepID=UPI0024764BFF|nr:LysM peptidoglycan-binding domain-containing protein [Streptomyces sp. SPB4]MDH6542633.1 nucleoid-associated protein YgaU [Streptomyces sp. SPB4]